ncbi:farnesyltranstransferase [Cystobacter ferrugineus]|uniref:Farnesyltranstransferase n=2 Tax=Cystobacter ferrugineus TaxID=83449 RepID=A0A1L9BHK8_9BACT|nr:farnesyltranstransferase [Cystobacter ferrugineus]
MLTLVAAVQDTMPTRGTSSAPYSVMKERKSSTQAEAPAAEQQQAPPSPVDFTSWAKTVQYQTQVVLHQILELEDERHLDPAWNKVLEQVRSYSLRPSKRIRPALVLVGYALGRGDTRAPSGLWRFAAATELLHTFMLIHDDVADQADTRRGGAALHKMLGEGRLGENLAIVIGDHLYGRSLEVMLGCNLPEADVATRYFLKVCRYTAAGQYMDIRLPHQPLAELSIYNALRVAYLKTALYGFTAPLVCGAMLSGSAPEIINKLERFGRYVGTAYQLRDDLLGLYGQSSVVGKPTDSDLAQGKRTFPLLAAYLRATPEARQEMETLCIPGPKDETMLQRARELVEIHGGRSATERIIERSTNAAARILHTLPEAGGLKQMLRDLLQMLMIREA